MMPRFSILLIGAFLLQSVSVVNAQLSSEAEIRDSGVALKDWVARWERNHSQTSTQVMEQGKALAARRHAMMAAMIRTNPEVALRLSLPERQIESFPKPVRDLLENHVSGRGDFSVIIETSIFREGRAKFEASS